MTSAVSATVESEPSSCSTVIDACSTSGSTSTAPLVMLRRVRSRSPGERVCASRFTVSITASLLMAPSYRNACPAQQSPLGTRGGDALHEVPLSQEERED